MHDQGFGLAAMAFWLFIAAVSVAGIWADQRNKREKQQTIREMLARSGELDEASVERLLAMVDGDRQADARATKQGLEIAYWIMYPISVGLVVMGLFLGVFLKMLGVAALVACVATGLMFASRSIRVEDQERRG
jgi:hypothetical protein